MRRRRVGDGGEQHITFLVLSLLELLVPAAVPSLPDIQLLAVHHLGLGTRPVDAGDKHRLIAHTLRVHEHARSDHGPTTRHDYCHVSCLIFFPRDSPVRTKSHSIPTHDFSRTSSLGNERALSVPPFEFSPAQSVYLTGLEYDPRNMMYLSFHFCRTAGLEGMDFPSWLRARFSTLLGPSRWRGPTRFERRHRMRIVIDGCRIERNEDINKYGHQRHRKYKKKQKFDREVSAANNCRYVVFSLHQMVG